MNKMIAGLAVAALVSLDFGFRFGVEQGFATYGILGAYLAVWMAVGDP